MSLAFCKRDKKGLIVNLLPHPNTRYDDLNFRPRVEVNKMTHETKKKQNRKDSSITSIFTPFT